MPPLGWGGGGGPRRNIAMTFGVKKTEWFRYSTVKTIEDMISRLNRNHERDRRTDRQTDVHLMTA